MRPDQLHVAQQIRRDKLRIQNQEFPHNNNNNNIEQLLSLHQVPQQGFNMDLHHQLRNSNNKNMLDDDDDGDGEAGLYSSDQMMNSFSTPSNSLHRNPLEYCYEAAEPSNNNNRLSYYYANETNQNVFLPSEINHSDTTTSEVASLMHHGVWGGGNSHNLFHENQASLWTNRGVTVDDDDNNNNMGLSFFNDCNNPQAQGLSLSLSSNSSQSKPSPSASNFEQGSFINVVKPIGISSSSTSTSSGFRNIGPLGPFTGYATILKSSRFLKPCQQLLEECCCESGANIGKPCENVPKWVSRDVVNVEDDETGKGSSSSGGSCSMFYGSKEKENSVAAAADGGGVGNSFCLSSSSRPECQKNKAQLLFMQQEVTRRYKQYHQQMQMVVSSFESVAGLSSATPYISMALKSLSRHFRCLKNGITEQLKRTCQVLGEDCSILPPTTTCSSTKIDSSNMTRLRFMNHSLHKNSNIDFVEPQQHVWRPQRGLPERSVAILKAWLFEHFLHPYPTDTDKHMLATQTGLSRNQVSNWFINARVRVWKPMVEEIHMLESKGTTEGQNQNNNKTEPCRVGTHERKFQCLEMGSSSSGIHNVEEQWNNSIQEKRSKMENEIAPNMDMGFLPYHNGSVSLTLGLRHGVENVQQQQLQQEVELRHQYGGHMIHDFVG
ncbi:unnamed protein product [Lathyrus sativus]|nr:unnamed protein product [Lathyrus sativus]